MKRRILAIVIVLILSVASNAGATFGSGGYKFEITLIDRILDEQSSGLLGKEDWYQWIYRVDVIPSSYSGHGLSHVTLKLQDCFDEQLLSAIEGTMGANSGNLAGLTGDKPRTYDPDTGYDGSTGAYGLKWDTTSDEQLDELPEYDYFWFSVPTYEKVWGKAVFKAGSKIKYDWTFVPDCPQCPDSVIPEPATVFLFGAGALGAGLRRRKYFS